MNVQQRAGWLAGGLVAKHGSARSGGAKGEKILLMPNIAQAQGVLGGVFPVRENDLDWLVLQRRTHSGP
jgi:hypothetical protein